MHTNLSAEAAGGHAETLNILHRHMTRLTPDAIHWWQSYLFYAIPLEDSDRPPSVEVDSLGSLAPTCPEGKTRRTPNHIDRDD